MKKLLMTLILIFIFIHTLCFGATYYVDNDAANDSATGLTGFPWKHCPGMVGWTGSATLSANDTVYFDSSDTWTITPTTAHGLSVVGGVSYIGDVWGGGTRAKIETNNTHSYIFVYIGDDDATYETVVKGFELDGNDYRVPAMVSIGFFGQSGDLTGATKRIQNCVVHDNDPGGTGEWDYGILVSAQGAYDIANVEVLDNTVYNTGEEGIAIYSASGEAGYNYDVIVRGNTAYDTGQDQAGYADGIILTRGNYNVTIEENKLYNNAHGILVEPYDARDLMNIVIRYNKIYDNTEGITFWNSNQVQAWVYGNVVYSNDDYGIVFYNNFTDAANAVYLYNNTSSNVGSTSDLYIHSDAVFATLEVKNNIYYPEGISDGGTNITASATNLATDPAFVGTPAGDYTLQITSDAIGAGTDLGNDLLYGLDPTSTWTDNVKPLNQDDYGDWEIGAYVYTGAAELGGPGTIPGGGLGSIVGGGSGSIIGTPAE